MKTSRFSDAQIMGILAQAENGFQLQSFAMNMVNRCPADDACIVERGFYGRSTG